VPFRGGDTIRAANASLADMQPILAVPGCGNNLRSAQFTGPSSWNNAFEKVIGPLVESYTSVGVAITSQSRIVSRRLVEDPEGLERIKGFLLNLPASIPFLWQNSEPEPGLRFDI
jgi:hypothetical protein